jgi:vacuolar-type H+-ATPase subunit F/Vma7
VYERRKKEENKKFPVVVYIPKPYSQNYTPMEKKEKFW